MSGLSARLLPRDESNIDTIREEIAKITGTKSEKVNKTVAIVVALEYTATNGIDSEHFRQSLITASEVKRERFLKKLQEGGWLPKNAKEVFDFLKGVDNEDEQQPDTKTSENWSRP